MSTDAPDALAHLARELLATARGGTLHVAGLAQGGDGSPSGTDAPFADAPFADAPFADVDGRPTFWCAPGSRVVAVAGQRAPAVLAVPAGRGRTLVLAGRLSRDDGDRAGGTDTTVRVVLDVRTVVVEEDGPGGDLVHHEVPLAAWWAASPDPLAGPAARLLTHANRAHGAQLRGWVAGLRGVPADVVLAAWLEDLDADGVEVRWLDEDGGHTTRVRFPTPARCAAHLGELLRDAVRP